MGRPCKTYHYFAREFDLANDSRIRRLLRRFGAVAIAVYEEFLAEIYATGSYYLEWQEDYLLDVSDRLYEDKEKVELIFQAALEAGLFHQQTFNDHHVLTSQGIQARYILRSQAVSHRQPEIILFNLLPTCQKEIVCGKNSAKKRKNASLREFAGFCGNLREFAGFCDLKKKEKEKEKEKLNQTVYVPEAKATRARVHDAQFAHTQGELGENINQDEENGLSDAIEAEDCKNTQNDLTGDSRGNFSDSTPTTLFDPVAEIVGIWNQTFHGSKAEYKNKSISSVLKSRINERYNVVSDLSVYAQVFQVCKRQIDSGQFPWNLNSVFKSADTFDQLRLLADFAEQDSNKNLKGYSDPSTYATEKEWSNYGK